MRFMMMVISKDSASPDAESSEKAASKMTEYNKTLQAAGVLLAADSLLPASTAARVSYTDGKAIVTAGPFAGATEIIGGYWIIQARTREEAIEWARRAPMSSHEVIEVRRIHETREFAEDARERSCVSNAGTE